jgi:hypothetical protein
MSWRSGVSTSPGGGRERTNHEGLVIRCSNSHTLQPVDNQLHHTTDGRLLRLSPLVKVVDKLARDLDGTTKFDDCPRPEAMGVEVGEADGDDAESEVGVGGEGAESHDGDSSLEREEVGTVMGSSLGEDTDAASVLQLLVHCAVHASLIDVG